MEKEAAMPVALEAAAATYKKATEGMAPKLAAPTPAPAPHGRMRSRLKRTPHQ